MRVYVSLQEWLVAEVAEGDIGFEKLHLRALEQLEAEIAAGSFSFFFFSSE
jgi:hypothetical protein